MIASLPRASEIMIKAGEKKFPPIPNLSGPRSDWCAASLIDCKPPGQPSRLSESSSPKGRPSSRSIVRNARVARHRSSRTDASARGCCVKCRTGRARCRTRAGPSSKLDAARLSLLRAQRRLGFLWCLHLWRRSTVGFGLGPACAAAVAFLVLLDTSFAVKSGSSTGHPRSVRISSARDKNIRRSFTIYIDAGEAQSQGAVRCPRNIPPYGKIALTRSCQSPAQLPRSSLQW